MRKRIRILVLAAIFGSVGVVIYKVAENIWLQKVRDIEQDPMKLLDFVPEAALQIKEFRRSKVEGGRKVWEVTGAEAIYIKAEKEAVIKRPQIIFYHENGETMKINGDEGFLFFTGREMEKLRLRGAVELNYQGYALQADEILYVQSNDHVISRGKVTASGEGLELEAVGMEISIGDERIRLQERVRTKIWPDRLKNKRIWARG